MKKIMAWLMSLALLLAGISAFAEGGEPSFEQLSRLDWEFSSGAGGWSTELQIAADGSFSGNYHDSEMGETGDKYPNGSVYVSAFTGQMSLGEKLDEHSWRIRVDKLALNEETGKETIEDGIRYVTSDAHGIQEGDEMTLYLPGTPVDSFTEDMRMWAHLMDEQTAPSKLENWFLYSAKNEAGFVGTPREQTTTLANPWTDLTAEQLKQTSGLSFGVPEGAQNVIYRWLDSDGLAEMQFTLDGDEYCARMQRAELSPGELMNIAGMYFNWENEENIDVDGCYGTLGQAQTGSTDFVELCQWYDANTGLMHSLSVYTTDLDGLDLTAVAQMVNKPAK